MLKRFFDARGFVAAFLLMITISACSTFGVPTPETFNQNLAVSVAANTSVRETATTLLQAGKISAADAENVLKQTDVAREGLNVARSLSGTDLASAQGRLEAVSAALKAMQAYLAAKQAVK